MKVPIDKIKPNKDNPRYIKDDAYKKLIQSIKEFPEMAEVRELVVNKDMVILGGNMRFKAMVEAGWQEVPVRVVDWSEDKQREFVIKDNVSGGEWDWDLLANEWDTDLLEDWGLDLPVTKADEQEEIVGEVEFTEELDETHNYIVLYFDNSVDWLQLQSRFELKTVKALDSKDNYTKMGTGRVVNGSDFINELSK